MAKPRKRYLGYYLAELMILVLGISLSFVLNEWRVQQVEQKAEAEMLRQFHENLVRDSTFLSASVENMQTQIEASAKLLQLPPNAAFEDSIGINFVSIMNYLGFYPSDITYQEMKNLGNSRILQDKALLKELTALYELDYDYVLEWVGADRKSVLDLMLPYIYSHMPFAPNLNFMVLPPKDQREFMRVLQEDETKYMIQNNIIMKAGSKVTFERALNEVRKILDMINEQLPPAEETAESPE